MARAFRRAATRRISEALIVHAHHIRVQPPGRPAPTPARGARSRWLSATFILGIIVLLALIAIADTRALLETLAHIRGPLLLLPVAASLASYFVMALSYKGIAHAAGVAIPLWDMVKITFVASSMNYVVATGGLSGFAVRLYFFTRLGVAGGTATTISLAQGFITNVSLLFFILAGFGYLIFWHRLSAAATATAVIFLGLCVLLAVLSVILLLWRELRRRIIFVAAQWSDRVMHRLAPSHKPARTSIWRFQRNLNRGIDFLLSRKYHMVAPTAWIILDWLLTMGILYSAFACVDHLIPLSVLTVGFAVGLSLSFVSVIPGGLGLMEGSMAAVFASLGVPFATAVVAALIFRFAFHVIPLVTSLFFFHGLFVEGRAHSRDAP